MPRKDYGTFSTPPPDLSSFASSFPSEPIRRTINGDYRSIVRDLDQALDDAMLYAGLHGKNLLVVLGERHGITMALWTQMVVLDRIRAMEDGANFRVLGLELSHDGMRRRIPGTTKISAFASDPVAFIASKDYNVDSLIPFALLTRWALAGCEPGQESGLNRRIDFTTDTPERHSAFGLRSVMTIRRLVAFDMNMVYACGLAHLPDLVGNPFLKRKFYILPICLDDSGDTAYHPSSGNLILIGPTTHIPADKLIAGYLAKQHPSMKKTALQGVTAYVHDPG